MKTKTVAFMQALKELVNGKMITREEWGNIKIYGFLRDGVLTIHKKEGYFQWVLNEGDMLANDWIVL